MLSFNYQVMAMGRESTAKSEEIKHAEVTTHK